MLRASRTPFFESIAILIGTVLGAGILGLPSAFSKIGIVPGLALLGGVAAVYILVALFFAEVMVRTRGNHQLVGYAGIYLGARAKHIQALAMITGLYGTLLAYVVGEGVVLEALFGGSALVWSVVFWAVFSVLLVRGMALVKRTELIMTVGIFAVIVVITLLAVPHFSAHTILSPALTVSNVFSAYGVVLFALSGLIALPEIRQVLRGQERHIPAAILWGIGIPVVVYGVFPVLTLGVVGNQVTEVATVGLGEVVGPAMVLSGNIFAFFLMATSFLTIGLGLQQTFQYDYPQLRTVAWPLTCLPVIGLFFLGITSFVKILGVVGAVSVGVNAILIVAMYWKAKRSGSRTPEFSFPIVRPVGWGLIVIFAVGIVFALF